MDSKGEAFLALTSSQEAAMFRLLSEKNIPVNKIRFIFCLFFNFNFSSCLCSLFFQNSFKIPHFKF